MMTDDKIRKRFKRLRNNHVKLVRNHECKTLKEFDKICRKYGRFAYTRKNYWYTWYLHYRAYEEQLKSEIFIKYSSKYKNLSLIREEALQLIKDGFSFEHKDGSTYKFVGIEITNEDYYYLFYNGEQYLAHTCVGRVTDVIDFYGK